MQNALNQRITPAGQAIEDQSMAILEAEAGPHNYTADQWPVVKRLIHTSADFDFNGLAEFHPQAVAAGVEAIRRGAPIIADVEMIRAGLKATDWARFGSQLHVFIDDETAVSRAKAANSTRAIQAMRLAHERGLLDGAIVGIGNAPTALLEIVRLVREEGARPGLVVGMPVGFVSAVESKDLLATVSEVPWMITRGRKGGSTLVVAAIRALYLRALKP
jgi:precorrin-8X/cobalt-precorrin-8 methylmutase